MLRVQWTRRSACATQLPNQLQAVSQLSVVIATALFAAAELLVLCCSRGLDVYMQGKGIPKSLRVRLAAACGRGVKDDNDLWSKLGKAKYEIFTPGRKKKAKAPKKRQPSVRSAAASQLSFVALVAESA